ncbi:MAG: hypothetical protein AAB606_05430 [Patescibacteria group bacterium]
MHDIKIPDSSGKKSDFEITRVASEVKPHSEPSENVKVNFEKFVNLIAAHEFEDVMKRHADEDIILSTSLLMDLASSHPEEEEESGKKTPILIIVGIIIGVVLTYLLYRFL